MPVRSRRRSLPADCVIAVDLGGTKGRGGSRLVPRQNQRAGDRAGRHLLGQEVAAGLAKRGVSPPVFVSPNVPGIPADNNAQVFAAYEKALRP